MDQLRERSEVKVTNFVALAGYGFYTGVDFRSVDEYADWIQRRTGIVGASSREQQIGDLAIGNNEQTPEIIGRSQLRQVGDDVGRPAAGAELCGRGGPGAVRESRREPV